jgi:hypothetical protein
MTWIVDYCDEAAGMVRYDWIEVEAASREEALEKFANQFKNIDPGFFATDARLKETER